MFLPLHVITQLGCLKLRSHHHWKRHRVQYRTVSLWDKFFSFRLWIGLWDVMYEPIVEATSRHRLISKTKIWHWSSESRRYMSDWSWFLPCVMVASEAGHVPGGRTHVALFSFNTNTYIYHLLCSIQCFSQYSMIFQLELGPHGNLGTRIRNAENIGTGCFLILYSKCLNCIYLCNILCTYHIIILYYTYAFVIIMVISCSSHAVLSSFKQA